MDKNCWESLPSDEYNTKSKSVKLISDAFHGKLNIKICLDNDGLTWKENNTDHLIKYQHITNVKRSKSKPEVCVNYLARNSDSLLQFQNFKIKFESHDISENWSKSISKQLKKKFNRIKSLVFIIDTMPNRSKLDGNSLFREYMKDIIRELKITHVIKEIKSIKDIDDLEELCDSIKSSDGVVIMSGDETASSIISNIINIFQTNNHCAVKHVPIPFVIIPIGFHNDISKSIWRDESLQNIFLNILLCKTFQADILSIAIDEKKNAIWGFNCHYGFYSILEKYRLENNDLKENFLIKKTLKKTRGFHCAIQCKLSNSSSGQPLDDIACNKNCSNCNLMTMSVSNTPIYDLNSSSFSTLTDSENCETMKDTNDISWIIVNSIPCRNECAENAFTPACHFNDGSADLILVKSTNINDMKKYLKCQRYEGSHLKLPFVESRRIEDVHVFHKIDSSWSNGCDKLMLESPKSKTNKNNVIVIEDAGTSSSSDHEREKETENDESKNTPTKTMSKKKKLKKVLLPVVKAYKELTKTTQASQENDNYKKPNMLESDKDKERKVEKQKKKDLESKKFESSWMLDYNFIGDVNSSVDIRVHSGVVSFFGDAMD